MKLNIEKFLKTELGVEMTNCIDSWELYLSKKDHERALLCQAQWTVYQMAIKQFYGVEYHFTRTDDYYGVVTEDESDWLYLKSKTWSLSNSGKHLALYYAGKPAFYFDADYPDRVMQYDGNNAVSDK